MSEQTPAAHWREKGEPDPHGNRFNCERHELTKGDLTDDELANEVFLRNYDIATLQAGKDRIRWLSRLSEKLQRENDEKTARIIGLESFFNSLTEYLSERQVISFEEWMNDWTVRSEIHDRPKQSLRQIEAKAIQKFINAVGTRTGDIIEIDVIYLPSGKYWLGNKSGSES